MKRRRGGVLDLRPPRRSSALSSCPAGAPQAPSLARQHLRKPSAAHVPLQSAGPQAQVSHGGRDRVPYELPGLRAITRQGETPRETLGHCQLPRVEESGPLGGTHKEPVPPFVGGGKDLRRPTVRPEDGWHNRGPREHPRVVTPRPRVLAVFARGILGLLGVREVKGATCRGGPVPRLWPIPPSLA